MPRSLPPIHLTESQDLELAGYRALPGQAVLGLILGLLSPVALIDPMLWGVPLLGIFVSVWALRRIKKNPSTLAGRKRALLGLTIALLSVAAAPTDWFVYRQIVQDQAKQVADAWFRCLLENRPRTAGKLVGPMQSSSDDSTASGGATGKRADADRFTKTPVARTLLAMGPRARVRFYQPVTQSRDGIRDFVELMYAVTYDDAGERKSFFVSVQLCRTTYPSGAADWRIVQTANRFQPQG
jgi:hypothetical protein